MNGNKTVSDYSIFETATATTENLLNKNLEVIKVIETAKTTLSDESIFKGNISTDCTDNLDTLNTKLNLINTNCEKIKSFLNEASTNYQTDDKKATSNIKSVSTNKSSSTNTGCSKEAEAMIDKAMETIGSEWVPSGYVWNGDPANSQFTCSGLIDYALGRPSQSSWPESLRDEIGEENLTTDVSQLKPGDIVFYEYYGYGHDSGWGHVGIYLGDNKIIDSSNGGVQIRDVNYMNLLGGGTLV